MLALHKGNVLAWPGRAPGVGDLNLIGAAPRLSVIAANGNMIDLTSAKKGTIVGGPTSIIDGQIGPAAKYASGSTDATTYAIASSDTSATVGAIFKLNQTSSNQGIFATANNNGGGITLFFPTGGNSIRLTFSGVANIDFNTTLSANVPYFLAVSYSPSNTNYLLLRLDNGKTVTFTTSGATALSGNGVFQVGNAGSGNAALFGSVAAAVFIPKYVTLLALLAWAQDPWAIWYPRTALHFMLSSLATPPSGFTPVFRKSFSGIGGRIGSRQPISWAS